MMSRDDVVYMYQEEQLSTVQIGKRLGITPGAVASILRVRGIKLRSPKEAFRLRFPGGRFGSLSSRWKGGKRRLNGYIAIYKPDHPRARNRRWVFEHVLVAEEKIGRHLKNNEIVHHLNGNKTDNHPDNLEVVTRGSHVAYHMHSGKSIQELLQRIAYLEGLLKKYDIIFS